MTDDEFLLAFEACTLARKDWTHEAHVRMAWLYLRRGTDATEVIDRVRDGIKKLNSTFVNQQPARMSGASEPKDPRGLDGYHETITIAFATVITARVTADEDFSTFRDHNPDLFDRTFPALLKHYSPERLYSEGAKTTFIEPDLVPLPKA